MAIMPNVFIFFYFTVHRPCYFRLPGGEMVGGGVRLGVEEKIWLDSKTK